MAQNTVVSKKNFMKKTEKQNRGAVMVEASIYFPLVICTVVAMLYLGLFQMEESALGYVAERIALEVSREEAYPGYMKFNMNEGRAVDFSWEGSMPTKDTVTSYYKAHHEDLGSLYREFSGVASIFGGSGAAESAYRTKYANTANTVKIIALGTVSEPDIKINKGFFSSTVTVSITHQFPVPGVIRYLGIDENQYAIKTTATKSIVNSGEFVRNVDLAVDAVEYLLEKLGLDDNVKTLVEKAKKVIELL